MITNIVVPFDFSESSFDSLSYASKLAMKFRAKVHLMAIQDPGLWAPSTVTRDSVLGELASNQYPMEIAGEQQMKEKLFHVMKEQVFTTVQGKITIIYKDFYEAFDHFVGENKVDLVIVGSKDESTFWDHFTGSLTQDLIQNTDIPLLNIGTEHSIDMSNILIVTDLSSEIPERLLQASRIFQHEGARLHLAHVCKKGQLEESEITDRLIDYAWSNQLGKPRLHVKTSDDFIEGLDEIIAIVNPDLILMKTYDKSAFWSFFEGRLAEKVIKNVDVPVMAEKVHA